MALLLEPGAPLREKGISGEKEMGCRDFWVQGQKCDSFLISRAPPAAALSPGVPFEVGLGPVGVDAIFDDQLSMLISKAIQVGRNFFWRGPPSGASFELG